jgi:aminopeptidase Y
MRVSTLLPVSATIAGTGALQIPFLSPPEQAAIKVIGETLPLVDSSALQDLVSKERLLRRSKELFEIAKLGEDEYNHPTRVIGSAGKSRSRDLS